MANLVCNKAPDFNAVAIMSDNSINENFNLMNYLNGDIGVLFFYPLNFTFVCPSEIIAFGNRLNEFHSRGVKIISISVDSHFSHLAWKNTPINKGGIGNIQFPMVADITKQISRNYNVLHEESVALRGSFLIDQNGIIRHQVVNDLPLGRNIDEMIRMIDSLKFFQKNGEVCPAGWQKGKSGMKADHDGVADYLANNAKNL